MRSLINLIIFTYNNEKEIREIIDNGKKLTKEVIVIDLESQDKTAEIARKLGAKVHSFPHPQYVELARDFGLKKATSQWVLVLDADERVSQELAKEIKFKLNLHSRGGNTISHFFVPRKNIFINRWLRHGGWWPDYQIRLINTDYFISWPKEIHSTPIIKGKASHLTNPIIHYFHSDLESMVKKTIKFETIESELLLKAKRKVSLFTFFRKFFGELWRRFFLKMGFMDGVFGIIESIYQAFSKTITYLFLYEQKYIKK